MTRAEYRALLERLEDVEDALIAREAVQNRNPDDYLPIELVERLHGGEHPIRIWRERRGLTLTALAERSGVPIGYLSEIETRKKPGSVAAFKKLATALQLDLDDLVQ